MANPRPADAFSEHITNMNKSPQIIESANERAKERTNEVTSATVRKMTP